MKKPRPCLSLSRSFLGLLCATALSCTPDPQDYPNLTIEELKVGAGASVGGWDTVSVHYTGRIQGGKVFDTSRNDSVPRSYSMRGKTLIEGWRIGLQGMKVGGRRKLTIPPELAFGTEGKLGRFPPNSTLVFDIELLGIE